MPLGRRTVPCRPHPRSEARRGVQRDTPPQGKPRSAMNDEIERFLSDVWESGGWEETEPDRVLATVLFTDIVGSSERAASLGDRAWRELLERHHELVRRQLVALPRPGGRHGRRRLLRLLRRTGAGDPLRLRDRRVDARSWASRCVPACTRANASSSTARSPASPCTPAHGSPPTRSRGGARLEHRQGPRRRLRPRLRGPRRPRAQGHPGRMETLRPQTLIPSLGEPR